MLDTQAEEMSLASVTTQKKPGVEVCTCDTRTGEVDAGRSLGLTDLPSAQGETLSQKQGEWWGERLG